MSGAIMNKVLDLFGMDNTEEEYDEEEDEQEYGGMELQYSLVQAAPEQWDSSSI